jgi:hypothetical protein
MGARAGARTGARTRGEQAEEAWSEGKEYIGRERSGSGKASSGFSINSDTPVFSDSIPFPQKLPHNVLELQPPLHPDKPIK